jgi:hypothetical protein
MNREKWTVRAFGTSHPLADAETSRLLKRRTSRTTDPAVKAAGLRAEADRIELEAAQARIARGEGTLGDFKAKQAALEKKLTEPRVI